MKFFTPHISYAFVINTLYITISTLYITYDHLLSIAIVIHIHNVHAHELETAFKINFSLLEKLRLNCNLYHFKKLI